MHYRKLVVVTAVVLPSLGILAAAGPASATGTPKGAGTLTCVLGGDATFNPPLTFSGTSGFRHEIVQFNLQLSDCTGPGTDTPQPNPTSATVTTKPLKVKDIKMGKTKVAGACGNDDFNPTLLLKSTETWAGTTVKDTKTVIGPVNGNSGSGTSKGSYAGAASIALYATTVSGEQFQSVCGPGGTGSISELDLDDTMSSVTVGGSAAS
jgi:hypothetical protein